MTQHTRLFSPLDSPVQKDARLQSTLMLCAFEFVSDFTQATCGRVDLQDPLTRLADLLSAKGAILARVTQDDKTVREVARSARLEASQWRAPLVDIYGMDRGSVHTELGGLYIILHQKQRRTDVICVPMSDKLSEDMMHLVTELAHVIAKTWQLRRAGLVSEVLASKSELRKTISSEFFNASLLGEENVFGLSKSEYRVCVLLRKGLKPKRIADELAVSIATVRTHLRGIYAKTGLSGQLAVLHRLGTDAVFQRPTSLRSISAVSRSTQRRAG